MPTSSKRVRTIVGLLVAVPMLGALAWFVVASIALTGMASMSPDSGVFEWSWKKPPFTTKDIASIQMGHQVRREVPGGTFVLLGPIGIDEGQLRALGVFNEEAIKQLIGRSHELIGTRDGSAGFVADLHMNVRGEIGVSHGGFVLTPTQDADGFIRLKISSPERP